MTALVVMLALLTGLIFAVTAMPTSMSTRAMTFNVAILVGRLFL